MDEQARDEMFAAAQAALSALKAADAAMTRHADAKIGGSAAIRIGAIHREIQGTIRVLVLRLAPVKPSPRVVLEAMLRAYEAAALDAIAAFYAAEDMSGDERAAWERFSSLETLTNELRRDVGAAICGKFKAPTILSGLWADYEARLRGERPLDAPPLEAT